jgi:hypothetical protein
LVEILGVVLGAILGSVLTLWVGRVQQRTADSSRRAAFATALLIELSLREHTFRSIYADERIGKRTAPIPSTLLDTPGSDLFILSRRSVHLLRHFGALVDEVRSFVNECQSVPPDQISVREQWRLRVGIAYTLNLVPGLRRSLEADGGIWKQEVDVAEIAYPELPSLPAPAFPYSAESSDASIAKKILP